MRASPSGDGPAPVQLHATCVAFDGRGILITGPSGTGKSGLGLCLIGLGAVLIADDLTRVSREDDQLIAHQPPRLTGVIEARGVGLLHVPHQPRARLVLQVDLSRAATERLPHNHVRELLGLPLDTIFGVDAAYFPAAIRALATGGRSQ